MKEDSKEDLIIEEQTNANASVTFAAEVKAPPSNFNILNSLKKSPLAIDLLAKVSPASNLLENNMTFDPNTKDDKNEHENNESK